MELINFKYEGMLAHSFDRSFVVTKFILPLVSDSKFSPLNFNERCNYLNENVIYAITIQSSILLISKYNVRKLYH